MVEKMGHKRMMQSMRMEWINEGKPRSSVHEDSIFDAPAPPARENGERQKTASRVAPMFDKTTTERPKTPIADEDADMDDLYDATPRQAQWKSAGVDSRGSLVGGTSLFGPAKSVEDGPPEDELDALLAGEEMLQTAALPAPIHKNGPAETIDYDAPDDELDALLAEEESLQDKAAKAPQVTSKAPGTYDDDEAALAEMDGLWDM